MASPTFRIITLWPLHSSLRTDRKAPGSRRRLVTLAISQVESPDGSASDTRTRAATATDRRSNGCDSAVSDASGYCS